MTGIEVNNFDRISNLLSFDGKTIYLVWLVVRNKDKSTELKGNNRNRTIKSYYFTTKEHFESRWDEIIKLCKTFNCRAYIGINGKPLKNVLYTMQQKLTEDIFQHLDNQPINLNGIVDHSVMKAGTAGNRRWVVDVDNTDLEYLLQVEHTINQSRSGHEVNVIDTIPTAHGYHFITYRFDPIDLATQFKDVEIKKEGLTLLYAWLSD